MEITTFYQDATTPYRELSDLLHKAFAERIDEGIEFTYVNYTESNLKKHIGEGYIFVCYDNNKPIGMSALLEKKKYGIRYLTQECVAVNPDIKNKGVASLICQELLKKAKTLDASCIISTTAEHATSSIKFHKKNRYIPFLFVSFPSTSYYSVCFIIPLKGFKIMRFPIISKSLFYISWVYCKIFKKENKNI